MSANITTYRDEAIEAILLQIKNNEIDHEEAVEQIFNINITYTMEKCTRLLPSFIKDIFNGLMANITENINQSQIMPSQEGTIYLMRRYVYELSNLFECILEQQREVIRTSEVSVRPVKPELRLVKNGDDH